MAIKAADREGRRATLSVRLTPEGRTRLEQAASASGRSLAQEVEMRLEKSFNDDQMFDAIFGPNRHSRNVVEATATAIRRVEMVRETRWVDDYATLWACRRAADEVKNIVFGYDLDEPKTDENEHENKEFIGFLNRLAHSAALESCRDLGMIAAGPSRNQISHVLRMKSAKDKEGPTQE